MVRKNFKLKYLFWLFYFILITTLCADGDNKRVINFSCLMLFGISLFLNKKLSKIKMYQTTNIWYIFFLLFVAMSIVWSISKADSYGMTRIILRQFIVAIALGLGIDSMEDIYNALKLFLVSCMIMMIKISLYMALGYSGPKMWDAICGNYFNTVAQILALNIAIAFFFF